MGAVSPPGGDFSEPVTQASSRVVGCLWALDSSLAQRRHFPAINWNRSFSLYDKSILKWFNNNISEKWGMYRLELLRILQRDAELQEVVQLVGPDALQDADRVTLELGKMLREDFLQQNAFSEFDAFCSTAKQFALIEAHIVFHKRLQQAIEHDGSLEEIFKTSLREDLAGLKYVSEDEFPEKLKNFYESLDSILPT